MSNRDYSDKAAALTKDFLTMLESHPESFDCLYFAAELSEKEIVAPDSIVDVVGSSESSELKIDYADPIAARAMIVPEEGLQILAYETGHGYDANSNNDPVKLLLNMTNVSKQSVVTWTEKTDIGAKTVSYYILNSTPFGRAPVSGMVHNCIPIFDNEAYTPDPFVEDGYVEDGYLV